MAQQIPSPVVRRRRGGLAALTTVIGVLLAVLLPAAPASAHDYLVSSSPAAGSTVTSAPSSVRLTFDAAVLDYGRGSTLLRVTGPGGRHYETACATTRNTDVRAAVRLGAAGRYTVTWRVVSADGHPVSNSIAFTFRPAAAAAAAAGTANGPDCGGRNAAGSTTAASGDAMGTVIALLAVAGGVLVLLVIGAIVLAVVLVRRRADHATED